MNKRGITDKPFVSVYYLVLGAFVLVWFLGGTKAIAQNTYFKQEYHGRDIALLIDTSQIADGEVKINYHAQEGFNYQVGDGEVAVKEKIPYVAYYAEDANDTINLEKEGDIIVVRKNE